jgi:hypothetical protein
MALGLAIVGWIGCNWAIASWRRQSGLRFLSDPERLGQYGESTDPELGTGLFI